MYFAATALLLPLVLATPLSQINSAEESPLAPLHVGGETIEDAYIVTFKKDVDPSMVAMHLAGVEDWHGADVSSWSHHAIPPPHHTIIPLWPLRPAGFSGELCDYGYCLAVWPRITTTRRVVLKPPPLELIADVTSRSTPSRTASKSLPAVSTTSTPR